MKLQKILTALIAVPALGVNDLSARELEKGEWYVKLILESQHDELEDPYNMLGQKFDSTAGFDSHDLPELGQTWAGTYLSVIFYRPEWETEKETFNTDFHAVTPKVSDEWTFEVRSDDPTRDLSLTWVGKRTRMKHMVLVDVQEDVVIPAVIDGVPQVYPFRMNGTVREFAWRSLTRKEFNRLFPSDQVQIASTSEMLRSASTSEMVDAALSAGNAAGMVAAQTMNRSAAERPKSNWLPRGWGQGEGTSQNGEPIPVGLPDDPFAD